MFNFSIIKKLTSSATGVLLLLTRPLLAILFLIPAQALAQNAIDTSGILELVNDYRSEARYCGENHFDDVHHLQWDEDLEEAALLHVKDMIIRNFYAHNNPDEESSTDRINNVTDQYNTFSENIARGQRSIEQVMESWINSPGHCANIMSPNITHVAVAVRTGAEIENRHDTTQPHWAMKLAGTIAFEDGETISAAPEPEETDEKISLVDLDQDWVMNQLNRLRNRGVQCDGNQLSPEQVIDWHEDVLYAAERRARSIVGNSSRYITSERRIFWNPIFGDNFERGNIVATKSSHNFDDALRSWLDDPDTCRHIMRNGITYAAVAAAYETGSDDGQAYWLFLFASTTPNDMKDEVADYFRGSDITIYGRNQCSFTQTLHNEFTEFGVRHNTAFYDNNEGPNRDRMHHAYLNVDRRIEGGSSLPFVTIGNTMYKGYYSAVALYRAVQAQR